MISVDLKSLGLTMSAVSALMMLRRHLAVHAIAPVEAVEALGAIDPDFAAADHRGALRLHAELPDEFEFTAVEEELQAALEWLIAARRPWWRKLFPLGRRRVAEALSPDEYQVFSAARLFDTPPSAEVMAWWYKIQATVRAEDDVRRSERGGEAELETIAYERKRLAALGISREPELVGFEANGVGYDIKSYDLGPVEPVARLIEVKSSTQKPPQIVLPRSEWEKAVSAAGSYYFYIWAMPERQLTIRGVSEMSFHVPSDSGLGRWSEVVIVISPDGSVCP